MNILPFIGTGPAFTIAATTANQRQQMVGAPVAVQQVIRVVNESASNALIAFGDATVDATAANVGMSVPPGERIFQFPPGATNVAVALRSGAGNVQVQLGDGV